MSADTTPKTTLEIRWPAGHVEEVDCLELVSVNGKPYVPEETNEEFEQAVELALARFEGRIQAIESIVGRMQSPVVPNNSI